jgi:calcineurin-like phosphoesterase family protein
MSKTFFISDTHFNHNKPFVYVARGFKTIEDMNEAIITNWNRVVEDGDKVFVLGDFALGTDLANIEDILLELRGEKHLIRGNHSTDTKWEFYKNMDSNANVYVHDWTYITKMGKNMVYMSHFPTMVNDHTLKPLNKAIINLFGHTHSKDKFFKVGGYTNYFMYNVACDAHNCTPVSWEDICADIKGALEKGED